MWSQYTYTSLPVGLDEPPPSQSQKTAPSQSLLLSGLYTAVTCLSCLILVITFPLSIWCLLKIVPDYQRVVVFRLGRARGPRGPGPVLLLPLIDQLHRVDMRVRAFNIPPSKVKSRDGALVSLGADVQFRVCDPVLSVLSVQDLNFVIRNTAQNLLTQSLGRKYLREIHSDRVRIGEHLKEDINEEVKPWGVCVERVELALEAIVQAPEDTLDGTLNIQSKPPSGGFEQLLLQVISLAKQSSENDSKPCAGLSLQQLLSRLEGNLTSSLVSEVGSSFQFYLTLQGGEKAAYFLDLTSGSGQCGWGVFHRNPDVTLELTEADLLLLIQGDLHPLAAYTQGRLRVTGDVQTALKLQRVLPVAKQ
ncbi:stomatin-like protein 1 [Spea bombifrons]|uniref:stomatin-like protein 1 n=1 Tax=Spea bombifrons TaxID=233779 RepID=UPI00234B32BB|nr:stomatin-like protein 1 [Spea bombifrons]